MLCISRSRNQQLARKRRLCVVPPCFLLHGAILHKACCRVYKASLFDFLFSFFANLPKFFPRIISRRVLQFIGFLQRSNTVLGDPKQMRYFIIAVLFRVLSIGLLKLLEEYGKQKEVDLSFWRGSRVGEIVLICNNLKSVCLWTVIREKVFNYSRRRFLIAAKNNHSLSHLWGIWQYAVCHAVQIPKCCASVIYADGSDPACPYSGIHSRRRAVVSPPYAQIIRKRARCKTKELQRALLLCDLVSSWQQKAPGLWKTSRFRRT